MLSQQLDQEQLRRDEIVTPHTRDHSLDSSQLSTTIDATRDHQLLSGRLSTTRPVQATQSYNLTSSRLSNERTYSYRSTYMSYQSPSYSEDGRSSGGYSYYAVRSGDTWETVASRVYGSSNVGDELKARSSMSYYSYETFTTYTEDGRVTSGRWVVRNATNLSQPIAGTRLTGF